jgi:hypothetical protein
MFTEKTLKKNHKLVVGSKTLMNTLVRRKYFPPNFDHGFQVEPGVLPDDIP